MILGNLSLILEGGGMRGNAPHLKNVIIKGRNNYGGAL